MSSAKNSLKPTTNENNHNNNPRPPDADGGVRKGGDEMKHTGCPYLDALIAALTSEDNNQKKPEPSNATHPTIVISYHDVDIDSEMDRHGHTHWRDDSDW